jgi:uncharacterized protein DUF3987/primase-like protein
MNQHFNQSAFELSPDKAALERFARAVFKHAKPEGYVSARIFLDDGNEGPAIQIEAVSVGDPQFGAVIYERARQAATWEKPAVFAPPVVTLKAARGAKESDVLEGVALSVDCDKTPSAALVLLREILGDPTVIVASGGEWLNPDTGEYERKVHVHWRLKTPTRTPAEHAQLKQARDLATKLVGADATAVPLIHPLRWPGSYHRKKEPKLAEIAFESENEIDLSEALVLLQDAVGLHLTAGAASSGAASSNSSVFGFDLRRGPKADNHEDVVSALKVIPNNDLDWHQWNYVGMATWAATAGSEVGAKAFMAWSAKSPKHNPEATRKRWDHYRTSPPSKIGFGTLVFLARQADPSWTYSGQRAEPEQAAPEPFDLWGHFEPPTLPRGVLPSVLENFAVEKGRELGADISGVAVAALAACAAAIPDHVKLQPKKNNTGWQVSARLWVAIVGPVSGMKSPIMTAAMRPLRHADTALAMEYAEARKHYNKLSKDEKEAQDPPKHKRHMFQDATVEAAQDIMRDSPNGVMCYRDELSSWYGAMERYANGKGSSDRGFWLEAFNGAPYSVDRIGRGSTFIPNLSVSILGGIQPEKIREVAASAPDDGLLQRFLTITVKPAVLGTEGGEGAAVAEYAALVGNLLRLGAAVLEFGAEAQAYRRELEEKHLKLVTGAESVNPKLAGHIGKYNGIFAQLCIIWHCAEHARFLAEIPRVISADTARRAGAFLHGFVLRHAVAFYSDIIGLSANHDAVTSVAGFILAHKKTKITHREIVHGDKAMRALSAKQREEVLEQLEALCWLERTPGPRANSPPQWLVNPLVHARFADKAKAEAARRSSAREMLAEIFGKKRQP